MGAGSSASNFDCILQGIDLGAMKLRDGRYGQILEDNRQVTFTVEPDLQRFSDDLFATYEVPAGAAVVLNSRTGRVLALSSRRSAKEFSESNDVALDPSPPAASLFKIVTAAALLEKGGATMETGACYSGGSQRISVENLADAPMEKSACTTLGKALGRSINAVFAKLCDRLLSRDTLSSYAERFGFNRTIPFDLPLSESSADIPEDRLELARTAAGFWHVHVSPLHAAVIAQSLAQNGSMLKPYIVDRVESPDGATLYEAKTQYLGRVVSQETAASLVEAMKHTVKSGTARKAFYDRRGVPHLPGIDVAGKTGTLNGRNPYRAYTWFVGLAPAGHPEVAISVLVVNEPKWRIKASTVAQMLLKKYFEISRK